MRAEKLMNSQVILRGLAAVLVALSLAACATSRPVTAQRYQPAPGATYTIAAQDRDTVASLAQSYQVSEDDLMALNNVYDRQAPLAGKTIRVPAYGRLREPRAEPQRVVKRDDRAAPAPAERAVALHADRIASAPLPEPRPGRASAKEQPKIAKDQPQERSWWSDWISPADSGATNAAAEKFVWPVKGPVVSPFGDGAGGEHNDGINILAPRGAPIRAAADGTVTYVGNELKGYGNLVLIRHDNGYVTAYAHADSIAVERGQHVTKGAIIARAGSTGDVREPQLHFEIRQGTRPVDPKNYLVASK